MIRTVVEISPGGQIKVTNEISNLTSRSEEGDETLTFKLKFGAIQGIKDPNFYNGSLFNRNVYNHCQ